MANLKVSVFNIIIKKTEKEERFNKGDHYDMELMNWFSDNYRQFPAEFAWWDKIMEERV